MLSKHLNKDNLHHAYLIEGVREDILPDIFSFCESLDIKTIGNPDFTHITIDNFRIDEAFALRAMSGEKSFSGGKKIFVLCVNTFSLDAENVLLKMFEEPIENTHFFLVVPDANMLLKTIVSRFYFISSRSNLDTDDAEKFLAMNKTSRINFIKEFFITNEDEEENRATDSNRSKALKLLNAIEMALHNMSKTVFDIEPKIFEHFFKVRKFLRMPGSSTKTLMESVALIIPNF